MLEGRRIAITRGCGGRRTREKPCVRRIRNSGAASPENSHALLLLGGNGKISAKNRGVKGVWLNLPPFLSPSSGCVKGLLKKLEGCKRRGIGSKGYYLVKALEIEEGSSSLSDSLSTDL